MANINKIRLSGTTYNIQDQNAQPLLTAGQGITIENNVISATGGDLSNYYTKSETSGKTELSTAFNDKLDVSAYTPTDLTNYYTKSETSGASQISTALNAKQDTLVSGTNIKTINNQSLLGSGNITIEGGSSINVVQTTGTSTTDVMSQSAATSNFIYQINLNYKLNGRNTLALQSKDKNLFIPYMTINGEKVLSTNDLSVIEASAITTSISSSSTDSQVPSAKAVYDMVGNINTILESI